MQISKRLIMATPIAAGLTLGLGFLMMDLIAIDRVIVDNSDKTKIAAINPVVIDILPPTRIERPIVRQVDVPPAPPSFERTKTGLPAARPLAENLPPPFILPPPTSLTKLQPVKMQDVQPINRFAPAMPSRADKSGYCKMRFDVSAEGSPFNVVATHCSASVFERASIKSVQKWRYLPQYQDGFAVPYIGLNETIRFNLLDENGKRIPE